MAYQHSITRRVEFSDTDMAGIMHFSNFFRYMEATEHAFYRSLGFSVHERTLDTIMGWPRVAASCEYLAPVKFEDELTVQLLVKMKGKSSLQLAFRFWKKPEKFTASGGGVTITAMPEAIEVARGALTVVCATLVGDTTGAADRMKSVPIPPEIAEKIDEAPANLLAQEKQS